MLRPKSNTIANIQKAEAKRKQPSQNTRKQIRKRILAKDVCPVFRNQMTECLEFSKFWFMDQVPKCELKVPVPAFTTLIERYVACKSGYMCENSIPLSSEEMKNMVFFSNGMPDVGDLDDIDILVIKDALNIKMTIEEKAELNYHAKQIRKMINSYINNKNFIESYYRTGNLYDGSEAIFREAADSGWFDKVPGIEIKREYNEKEFKYEEFESEEGDIDEEMDGFNVKEINDEELISMATDVVNELAPAGDSEKFINSIINDGSRDVFVSSILDIAKGLIKSAISLDFEGFKKKAEEIDTDAVKVTSYGFSNVATLINILLDGVKEFRNAKDIDDAINIINSVVKKIMEIFEEDEDFINDLKKLLKKVANKMTKKTEVKENASEQLKVEPVKEEKPAAKKEVKKEKTHNTENVAAMDISKSFPAIASVMGQSKDDEEIPSFCRVDNTNEPMRSETPSFIVDANIQQPMYYNPPKQIAATYYIEAGVEEQYPFIRDIALIGIDQNVSLNVLGIRSGDKLLAIQFCGYTNGNWNWLKSFTIDLGTIIDDRTKVFFNGFNTGFGFMENCNAAYAVFSKEGELNKEFFKQIFTVGTTGLDSKTINQYRMFNSNMMQLNRIIDRRSINEQLGKIGNQNRNAVKDSLFKMMRIIKDLSIENHIDFGRFRVIDFDGENLHYDLSNIDMGYCDKPNRGPRAIFSVDITKDKDGNPVYNGKKTNDIKLTFYIKFVDNVFDASKLVYPDYATTVTVDSDDNKEDVVVEG